MTAAQIRQAITDLLHTEYPNANVYEDNLPRGFSRPSFLLETDRIMRRRMSAEIIQVEMDLTITCFCTVNEFGISRQEDLALVQDTVIKLFDRGSLPVDDRAPNVTASAAGVDVSTAYVDLLVTYSDEPSTTKPQYPYMEEITITTTTEV